jgi:hypothetical protein
LIRDSVFVVIGALFFPSFFFRLGRQGAGEPISFVVDLYRAYFFLSFLGREEGGFAQFPFLGFGFRFLGRETFACCLSCWCRAGGGALGLPLFILSRALVARVPGARSTRSLGMRYFCCWLLRETRFSLLAVFRAWAWCSST